MNIPREHRVIIVIACSIFLFLAVLYIRRFSTLLRNKWVPTIGTFPRQKKLIKEHISIETWATMIDLWCGHGGTLRFFAKNYTCSSLVGVDLNNIAIQCGKILHRWKWYDTIELFAKNMYSVDLQPYDYVYIFLMPNIMQQVQDRFETHLPEHTTVICMAFRLPTRTPTQIIKDTDGTPKIFLYKKS